MLKGKRCGEWGDLCDHISADAHAAALQEHCFAENLYNAAIASWGEHWTQDQWDQDFACNTTGPEGTRKSLLTQEEQEIIGFCWPETLHTFGILDISTNKVYKACDRTRCKMSHNNLRGFNPAQVDLIEKKMIDMAARPRLQRNKVPYNGNNKGGGKGGKGDGKGGKDGGKGKDKRNKVRTCANCSSPGHKSQECDVATYPNIHDFCWMCNCHGHNAIGCRGYPEQKKWEAELERQCVKAEAEQTYLKDRFGKPYTGSQRTKDPYAEGRNLSGKPPWTSWTKEELDLRAEAREREGKLKAPVMAAIKNRHPNLVPDPA